LHRGALRGLPRPAPRASRPCTSARPNTSPAPSSWPPAPPGARSASPASRNYSATASPPAPPVTASSATSTSGAATPASARCRRSTASTASARATASTCCTPWATCSPSCPPSNPDNGRLTVDTDRGSHTGDRTTGRLFGAQLLGSRVRKSPNASTPAPPPSATAPPSTTSPTSTSPTPHHQAALGRGPTRHHDLETHRQRLIGGPAVMLAWTKPALWKRWVVPQGMNTTSPRRAVKTRAVEELQLPVHQIFPIHTQSTGHVTARTAATSAEFDRPHPTATTAPRGVRGLGPRSRHDEWTRSALSADRIHPSTRGPPGTRTPNLWIKRPQNFSIPNLEQRSHLRKRSLRLSSMDSGCPVGDRMLATCRYLGREKPRVQLRRATAQVGRNPRTRAYGGAPSWVSPPRAHSTC